MPRPRDTGAEARILDAAVRRHAEGDEGWSLSALAADAGVSRASLYRRFRTREALLDRLAEERGLDLREDSADTRTRVLDALSQLLRGGSLAATTIEEVARQAGVSSVTVYRHFGDRKGLLRAFAAERTPRRLAARLKIAAGEELEEELLTLARSALAFVREYRELIFLALSPDAETKELFADLRSLPGTSRAALASFLQRHVEAGRIVGAPTQLVPYFVGGLLSLGLANPAATPEEIETNARFAVRTFLAGARAPKPGDVAMPDEPATERTAKPANATKRASRPAETSESRTADEAKADTRGRRSKPRAAEKSPPARTKTKTKPKPKPKTKPKTRKAKR